MYIYADGEEWERVSQKMLTQGDEILLVSSQATRQVACVVWACFERLFVGVGDAG